LYCQLDFVEGEDSVIKYWFKFGFRKALERIPFITPFFNPALAIVTQGFLVYHDVADTFRSCR
jgi:hypothetical protein